MKMNVDDVLFQLSFWAFNKGVYKMFIIGKVDSTVYRDNEPP